MRVSTHAASPLPSPEVLGGYRDVAPELPERMMRMVEEEQRNRHAATRSMMEQQFSLARIGLSMAFVIAVGSLGVAAVLGFKGEGAAAAVVGSLNIGVLVGAFIRNTKPPKP